MAQRQHTCFISSIHGPGFDSQLFLDFFLLMLLRFIDGNSKNRGHRLSMSLESIQYWIVARQLYQKMVQLAGKTIHLHPKIQQVQFFRLSQRKKRWSCYPGDSDKSLRSRSSSPDGQMWPRTRPSTKGTKGDNSILLSVDFLQTTPPNKSQQISP